MKNILYVLLCCTTTAYSQSNTFPNSGNTGIGTLSPSSKLSILSNNTGMTFHPGGSPYFGTLGFNRDAATGHIFDSSANAFQINNGGNTQNLHFQVYNGNGHQASPDALVISGQNGNVGIGVANPTEALDVSGNLKWNGYRAGNVRALNTGYSGGNYGGIGYNIDYTSTTGVFNRPLNDQSSYLEFTYGGFKFFGNARSVSANGINLNGGGDNLNLFAVIDRDGNFGIGTATPQEKLAVNGKVRAKEIKVEASGWPDYIFEDGYKISSLDELEQYIKLNRHLPDVPSAREVDQNGIALGEMNKILLKKIEELTLHLIEKDKQLKSQQSDHEILADQVKKLTGKINQIESQYKKN